MPFWRGRQAFASRAIEAEVPQTKRAGHFVGEKCGAEGQGHEELASAGLHHLAGELLLLAFESPVDS